jgi:hypothetical protein
VLVLIIELLILTLLSDNASVSNRFIAGEPIKYPTKVVFGLSKSSFGVPSLNEPHLHS